MKTSDLHRRLLAIHQASQKLMADLEKEMATEEEQTRVDAVHAAAVEQAKRELAAESKAK